MNKYSKKEIAGYIDHTLLKPEAKTEQIKLYCEQAIQYGFAAVCVNPCHVKMVADCLKNTSVKTCSVVGFPLGADDTDVKAFEAKTAVNQGAKEIDMVINIGALKEGNLLYVENDIKSVIDASKGAQVKVIIETCLLTNEEKETVCRIAANAGAAFVKTSTGLSTAGATVEDISLMKKTVGASVGVKASGGVRTLKDVYAMLEAGANRIGSSYGIQILGEIEE